MARFPIYKIKNYLIDKKFHPRSIKYLGGGNHFNYKFKSGRRELVLRISNPKAVGAGEMFNVESEFKLLKLVEKYHVSPKPLILDKKGFSAPVLLESYIWGTPYAKLRTLDGGALKAALELIAKTSRIKISPGFFKFRYQDYSVNIKNWNQRIKEIEKIGKRYEVTKKLAGALKILSRKGAEILNTNKQALFKAWPEFIYNDIHGENMFWLKKKKAAVFVDWQKVGYGDPSFMLAVFVLAFESKASGPKREFYAKILKEYKKIRTVKNLDVLFNLRILEREIANAIWIPWHSLKTTGMLPFKNIRDYSRISRAENAIKDFALRK
ncbi:hypothetical protein A3G55_01225 [Candidatus Giovannonibacteria bacterium RIFCSPLOWO2_12_FULL_44_25]|uniref:Aminoglycoside phosphotransferase domain-containing protein n=2 Tax=Candidatus Giovannoniibacteriota TaxID=1752738 RepID=A0A1F5WA18_9BACT|nr:MAG: hypothetical protein UW53_C0019G0012 [Candidatus Giovannonibacteria bacterium GW2011_GWA1_44_25]KKU29919.1 MAG: hypothetical protein UX43_C0003G0012 [Candidatus Giovannonibacteria bacterium GW2011_GWB1_46_20]OGF50567.1 MAG: hypothetical protein A2120_04040 [Candidatus Giovannonibacteria bacterium GWA2_45_15]OGF60317.1 MAG: hypothetical protein A2W40_04095 [Candidatus Giovannonibacteria bacterium RIFCSPHIGHO2_01_45_12]OGF60946.1 MAG: hypothetical protein A2656_01675 [Candidatus Giovannon